MMDITKLFKASVKAVKLKGKLLESPDRILPTSKDKKSCDGSFNKRAVEVVANISKLRDFLFTYQTEYLGEFSPLVSISSAMSEEERQQIDTDAQTFITSCSNAIASLKAEISMSRLDNHPKVHCSVVLELLDSYLKDVCKLYTQQRAFRVKQAIDQKRMSRLKPEITRNECEESGLRNRWKEKGGRTKDDDEEGQVTIENNGCTISSSPSQTIYYEAKVNQKK